MSLRDKLTRFLSMDDEGVYEEESHQVAPSFFSNRDRTEAPSTHQLTDKSEQEEFSVKESTRQITTNSQSHRKTRIRVMEPRMYSEVRDIADVILANESVVLNFRRMDKDQAKKVIDFLMGITYAIQGDIQKIGDEMFLCTPEGIEIEGADLSSLKQQELT